MAEFHRPRQNQQTPRAHQCSAPNPDSQENTKATPSEFLHSHSASLHHRLCQLGIFVIWSFKEHKEVKKRAHQGSEGRSLTTEPFLEVPTLHCPRFVTKEGVVGPLFQILLYYIQVAHIRSTHRWKLLFIRAKAEMKCTSKDFFSVGSLCLT